MRNANLGAAERQRVDNVDPSLEQERMSLQVRPLVLDAPLGDRVQPNAAAASRAGVEIRLRPTHLQVNSDPALLTTMVQNLLSNAFKYAAGKPVLLRTSKLESTASPVGG